MDAGTQLLDRREGDGGEVSPVAEVVGGDGDHLGTPSAGLVHGRDQSCPRPVRPVDPHDDPRPLRTSLVGRVHHHDRTTRVRGAVQGHRTQEGAAHRTPATAADHQQVGVPRPVDEFLGGRPDGRHQRDRDLARTWDDGEGRVAADLRHEVPDPGLGVLTDRVRGPGIHRSVPGPREQHGVGGDHLHARPATGRRRHGMTERDARPG